MKRLNLHQQVEGAALIACNVCAPASAVARRLQKDYACYNLVVFMLKSQSA
jgi:hypothetical protein